ncbi:MULTISPECIES: rod-binding protein [Rahnella]|uniref:Rod-binding protein n=1 Tax=Rahnella laticis TaxID=2787622 RepID=A0ABS0E057_9GAMM|nr:MULTISPECIES: rod-binding protein [Rahnella]MBF7978460.1 rod-binding protein [Rahnella laticis]MBF7995255.1 rod-binding protein [Rahnella laticis]MBF7998550.1 rod-binding protein [Rahnella sp. LAC-M12]
MINATGPRTVSPDFTGTPRPQGLEQAAEQFEALFLRNMLASMRKSTDVLSGEDGMFSSKESRNMRDFYDDALAQNLASQRSTGIASLLIQQLSPQVNKKSGG